MKKVRLVTHQEVVSRLLKKPGFRQGYEEELDTLLKVVEALNGELVVKIRQRKLRRACA